MSLLRSVVAATALAVAATAALVGLPVPAAVAADCAGVTVVVDASRLSGGIDQKCQGSSGGTARGLFAAAGHTQEDDPRQPGFVCYVDSQPSQRQCARDSAAGSYWSLWVSDGRSGTWSYSSLGVDGLSVPAGGYVAWVWQSGGRSAPGVAATPRSSGSSGSGDSGGGSSSGGSGGGSSSGGSGSSGSGSSGSGSSGSGSSGSRGSGSGSSGTPGARGSADAPGSAAPGASGNPSDPGASGDPSDPADPSAGASAGADATADPSAAPTDGASTEGGEPSASGDATAYDVETEAGRVDDAAGTEPGGTLPWWVVVPVLVALAGGGGAAVVWRRKQAPQGPLL
ncbi:hypothetical protein RDV89_01905 [Nocardioides zeae]|uniref:Secreted protein n=1 Tax=Nocardioides imazamoxiresistens TaxID=3231893 RepID=A0ABU3PRF2_9ACTN|nr:hypothetical protein [Nocardioides zeae]MDT9591805.1 hypothetical protein [Nocardioides zeae]